EVILKWILQRLRRWPREPAGRKGSYRGGRRRGARGVSRYQRVDRGAGSRSGQLLQHVDDPKRWLVRAFIGRNAKGKMQYRSEVVTGRKRDAEARLIELLQDKNRGKLTPRSAATLADLSREWLAHKGREVTPRTLRGYRDALDLYVLPSLGHRKVG